MAGERFDCIVIGGGPGGYVAAIRASQLGLRVALVEREHLGGICLNWGCIPTKALLRASELRHLVGELGAFGLEVGEPRVDWKKLVGRSRQVAKKLSAGVAHLMKKNGVAVFDAHGRLAGAGRVALSASGEGGGPRELEAPHVILATGARARGLRGVAPDARRVWTYKEAMLPEALPQRLLVVGSGAIGIEFASFYRDMGSEVTVVEILPRILPMEDEEVSQAARRVFERQGMTIHTEASVEALVPAGDGVRATLRTAGGESREAEFDRAILAVGITGNVEELGLEGTGVRVEKGHVVVNEWCETDEPGVHAIGDLVGPPWLAHKAMHEGVVCVEHLAGVSGVHPLDTTRVPGCTYCRPQVASVGLTERAAREAGREVRVGRFPLSANGKALAIGETQGFAKTVFDAATGELLGAHLFGAEVTEMIQGFVLARGLEATEAELARAIFPHPTLSEAMHEAVLAAFDGALHI
jgi:dihydrolipoamide dehydrogenase